jgi:hypothetical protein
MPILLRDRLSRIFLGRRMAGRLESPQPSRVWPLHLDYAKPGRVFYRKTRKRLPVAAPQTILGLVILPSVVSS